MAFQKQGGPFLGPGGKERLSQGESGRKCSTWHLRPPLLRVQRQMTGTTHPHYLKRLRIVRMVHLALCRATGHTALPHQLPPPQVHVGVTPANVLAVLLLRHLVRPSPQAHVARMAGHTVTALGPSFTALAAGTQCHRKSPCLRGTRLQARGPGVKDRAWSKNDQKMINCKPYATVARFL